MFFSYWLFLSQTKYVVMVTPKPDGWFHLTVVYHISDDDDVMEVYYDGELSGKTDTAQNNPLSSSSSGNMSLGRLEYDYDGNYASLEIDEITLWDN